MSYYCHWQWWGVLPLLPVYMHVLGPPADRTASPAARVPALIPRRASGGPFGASGSASTQPAEPVVLVYPRSTIQEKWHIAVERKEVEISGTCPIARCDRGFNSCRFAENWTSYGHIQRFYVRTRPNTRKAVDMKGIMELLCLPDSAL